MNDARTKSNSGQVAESGFGLDDAYYTLFRHKRLLQVGLLAGLIAAIIVAIFTKPTYSSRAKVKVSYVMVDQQPTASKSDGTTIIRPWSQGETILSSEIETITSRDVALRAATNVGPARILAKVGGGDSAQAAAGVIRKGLNVLNPKRSDVLIVTFEHPDHSIVQPVLDGVIEAYEYKHFVVNMGVPGNDDYYSKEIVNLRKRLSKIEEQIEQLLNSNKVVSIEEAKRVTGAQIEKLKDELLETQTELAQHRALVQASGLSETNNSNVAGLASAIPAEVMDEYLGVSDRLSALKIEERRFIKEGKLDLHPLLKATRDEIAIKSRRKSEMEQAYPNLAQIGALAISDVTTNAAGINPVAEKFQVNSLTIRETILKNSLDKLQAEAMNIMTLEPVIAQLQRERDELEALYNKYTSKHRMGNSPDGNVPNIRPVEAPTPPLPDYARLKKLVGAALGGCIGLALLIAVLIDFVFDRTVRRPVDVERSLRMPVFLAVPDTAELARAQLADTVRNGHRPPKNGAGELHGDTDVEEGIATVTPWSPCYHLRTYTDGLRERLITHFEIRGIDHKPKLVAVSGCGIGAGVSSVASGLAVSLSMSGDGKVLFVDMTSGNGAVQSFYKGKLAGGVSETPESDEDEGVAVKSEKSLVMSSLAASDTTLARLAKVMPDEINRLVPKLKTTEYDFIVFDMPVVSPSSVTPRLASQMDIVLMVLESEKTGLQMARQACRLLAEARANVAMVLNKYHRYVPAKLSHEV